MSRHHRYKTELNIDAPALQRSMAGLKDSVRKDAKRTDSRINQSFKKLEDLSSKVSSDVGEINSYINDLESQLDDLKNDISYLLDQREKLIYWLMLLSWITISFASYIIFKNT